MRFALARVLQLQLTQGLSTDNLRQAIVLLGPTPATIQMETIDLSGSPKEIARAVEELDRQYGPISHMYAISGVSNHTHLYLETIAAYLCFF